jgi:hypothetical protein
MKTYLISLLGVALFAPAALADNAPPLEPGKPAGVSRAQLENGQGMLIVAGGALVGIGIALATADNGPQASSTSPAVSAPSTTTP